MLKEASKVNEFSDVYCESRYKAHSLLITNDSMIVPPPPPSNVPRPPPSVSIPTAASSTVDKGNNNSPAAKNSGGSLLDMTDMFVSKKGKSTPPPSWASHSQATPTVGQGGGVIPTDALPKSAAAPPKPGTPAGTPPPPPAATSSGPLVKVEAKAPPPSTPIPATSAAETTMAANHLSPGGAGTSTAPAPISTITPPRHVCVAPRTLVLNGEAQTMVIPPASSSTRQGGPFGRKSGKAKESKPPGGTGAAKERLSGRAAPKKTHEETRWKNVYNLQPSPSSEFHHIDLGTVSGSTSFKEYTRVRNLDENKWRGVYWKNVDVHRYIARHYFGEPLKKE